jgi:hypothetical protein
MAVSVTSIITGRMEAGDFGFGWHIFIVAVGGFRGWTMAVIVLGGWTMDSVG